jgi:hypothetical protein
MKRYRKSRRRSSQRNNRSRYSRKRRARKIKGGSSLYTAPIAAANFPLSLAPSPPFTVEQMNHTQYA